MIVSHIENMINFYINVHVIIFLDANDVEEKPAGVQFNEGQAIVPKFLTAGVISQIFPLHELPTLKNLQKTWVQAFFKQQPLGNF